jgi:hypothetical protein
LREQVNSDCRQLARSRQFSVVQLDYNEASIALVELLASETAERVSRHGRTSRPSLGACIRHLTVFIRQASVQERLKIPDIDQETYNFLPLSQPKWQTAIAEVSTYLTKVENILCQRQSLPHLEYLDW